VFVLALIAFSSMASVVFAQKKITLEVWIWETVDRWYKKLERSGFSKDNPNVEVKYVALSYGDLHDKYKTSIMAGLRTGLPDIARIGTGDYAGLAESKGLTDLTERVAPYKKNIIDVVWQEIHHSDGRIYKVPDDLIVQGLSYRWDIFQKAGLPSSPKEVQDMLSTWDDVLEIGPKLKSMGVMTIGLSPNMGWPNTWFETLANQDTNGYFDRSGQVIFDSEYHVKIARTLKKLWDSGFAYTEALATPQYWTAIKEGKLAMEYYPQYFDFIILDNAPDTAKKWRAVKLPAVTPGGRRTSYFDCCGLTIPAVLDKDKKEAAWTYSVYMNLATPGQFAHMEIYPGAFNAWIPALNMMRGRPSPVLDGQNTYDLYLSIMEEEGPKPLIRPVDYNKAAEYVTNAMQEVWRGRDAAAALKEAADKLRAERRRR